MQRPTLHLDPWVTDLSTHLPRIPRHVKVSKYHTLIDSESYFLPLCSLRVSVLRLTNWGGAAAESQELLRGRPCPSSRAPRSGSKPLRSPWQSVSAGRSSERNLGIGVIFWRDPGISVWQKSRNILERKSDLCVNEEYSWKETLLRNWNLETAVVLSWVISSLYTLIIDGTLITVAALGDAFLFAFFKYFLV